MGLTESLTGFYHKLYKPDTQAFHVGSEAIGALL